MLNWRGKALLSLVLALNYWEFNQVLHGFELGTWHEYAGREVKLLNSWQASYRDELGQCLIRRTDRSFPLQGSSLFNLNTT